MRLRLQRYRERVLALGYAYRASRTLFAAVNLGVFGVLGRGALRVGEVVRRLRSEPRATALFLDALAAMRLIVKRGARYANTPAGCRIFLDGAPEDARPILQLHDAGWAHWRQLEIAVHRGRPTSRGLPIYADPVANDLFIRAMHASAIGHADRLARRVSLAGRRRLLDVGGGSGAFTYAFCRANQRLTATIVDLPSSLRTTRRFLRASGLGRRVRLRPGDCLRDRLGDGYDCTLVSHLVHGFSEAENVRLFRRVAQALAPGGLLIVQDFFLEPSRTAPPFAALFALLMLLGTPRGRTYTASETIVSLREAGFVRTRWLRGGLPRDISLVLAEKSQ